MERRDDRNAAIIMDSSAQSRNSILLLQNSFRGEGSQRANDARADELDLSRQDRTARRDLQRLGISVSWRPALQDVRDVNLVSLEIHCSKNLIQKLSRGADERLSLQIFIATRRFPDQHELCLWISHAEHERGARRSQGTTLALGERIVQLAQGRRSRWISLPRGLHARGLSAGERRRCR